MRLGHIGMVVSPHCYSSIVSKLHGNKTGMIHNGTGTQQDWDTMGLVPNGTGTQRDSYIVGLRTQVNRTQRDCDTPCPGTKLDWDT